MKTVLIVAIICVTVVALSIIDKKDKNNKK